MRVVRCQRTEMIMRIAGESRPVSDSGCGKYRIQLEESWAS
jgi:hypothetical protein